MGWWQTIREAFVEPEPEPSRFYAGTGHVKTSAPRVAAPKAAPSREDFAVWRDDPVTRFVRAAMDAQAEHCRDVWLRTSWESGTADQNQLNELRIRADMYDTWGGSDYDAFCDALGLEPEPLPEADDG